MEAYPSETKIEMVGRVKCAEGWNGGDGWNSRKNACGENEGCGGSGGVGGGQEVEGVAGVKWEEEAVEEKGQLHFGKVERQTGKVERMEWVERMQWTERIGQMGTFRFRSTFSD